MPTQAAAQHAYTLNIQVMCSKPLFPSPPDIIIPLLEVPEDEDMLGGTSSHLGELWWIPAAPGDPFPCFPILVKMSYIGMET